MFEQLADSRTTGGAGLRAIGAARARPIDGQSVTILDALAKGGVAIVALKENIRVEGKQDIQTKVVTTLFALFAEVERDLISERTGEGLARARRADRKLGRPKGSPGVSRLDGREDDIRCFLELGASKTAIAKLTGVSSHGPVQLREDARPRAALGPDADESSPPPRKVSSSFPPGTRSDEPTSHAPARCRSVTLVGILPGHRLSSSKLRR